MTNARNLDIGGIRHAKAGRERQPKRGGSELAWIDLFERDRPERTHHRLGSESVDPAFADASLKCSSHFEKEERWFDGVESGVLERPLHTDGTGAVFLVFERPSEDDARVEDRFDHETESLGGRMSRRRSPNSPRTASRIASTVS